MTNTSYCSFVALILGVLAGIGVLMGATEKGLAEELVIGEKTIPPGITFVFEGAIKDTITPAAHHLPKEKTDVHLEARVNWAEDAQVTIPQDTPRGGFVAYIHIDAQVTNERTGKTLFVRLVPHINLVDNLHYAWNIALPGGKGDTYTVTFFVSPPDPLTLSFHHDWASKYGAKLFEPRVFTFEGINFAKIVDLER